MTDYTELKRLAEVANAVTGDVSVEITISSERGPNQPEIDAVTAFVGVATPAAVLALIAENERLNAENKQLILLECHGGTAEAAINLLAERDQLKAELEKAQLIGRLAYNFDGYKAVLDDRDQLKAENEAMAEFKAHMVQLRETHGFDSWAAALVKVDKLNAENEALRKNADHLQNATAFVQKLCDSAGNQPSVATGYLHDILAAMGKGEQS